MTELFVIFGLQLEIKNLYFLNNTVFTNLF